MNSFSSLGLFGLDLALPRQYADYRRWFVVQHPQPQAAVAQQRQQPQAAVAARLGWPGGPASTQSASLLHGAALHVGR